MSTDEPVYEPAYLTLLRSAGVAPKATWETPGDLSQMSIDAMTASQSERSTT